MEARVRLSSARITPGSRQDADAVGWGRGGAQEPAFPPRGQVKPLRPQL